MFITFIYKIGKRTYYGKYVFSYMSDDHEGLDDEIRPLLLDGINRFRRQKGLSRLRLETQIIWNMYQKKMQKKTIIG